MADNEKNKSQWAWACLLLLLPCAWWWAWCVHHLWVWFVMPIGLPDISLSHLYGLHILVGAAKGVPRRKEHIARNEETLGYMICAPPLALLMGWIAHRFMTGAW